MKRIKETLGLTRERYNQLMELYENDTDEIRGIVSEWGAEQVNRGYGIFVGFYGNNAEHIEKIDCVGAFDGDMSAAKQAEKDGVKIIHDMKFPEEYDAAYIDTPENRQLLMQIAL